MGEEETNKDEPELIVDTDWKEQVARERESSDEATSQDESHSTEPSAPNEDAAANEMPAPPPASFTVLISMLFSQAMAMLGQMPDPSSGETTINKPFAKHYIDTLEMLQEKTRGNLDDEETSMLSEALHALRMMYVNAKG